MLNELKITIEFERYLGSTRSYLIINDELDDEGNLGKLVMTGRQAELVSTKIYELIEKIYRGEEVE